LSLFGTLSITGYIEMLDAWFGNAGGLFAAYQLANTYGIYGSWGALEYLDQPVDEAHKYRALIEYRIHDV
jgi:hypothetical protein